MLRSHYINLLLAAEYIMNIIEKSLEIALKAYSGQCDKAGKTYILHPLRLM